MRVIAEVHGIRLTVGGEPHSGWLPPSALRAARGPSRPGESGPTPETDEVHPPASFIPVGPAREWHTPYIWSFIYGRAIAVRATILLGNSGEKVARWPACHPSQCEL
jgi:hypothetical protein